MLSNPLCSFWQDELSKVWAGTEVEQPQKKQKELWETEVDQILARPPQKFKIEPVMGEGVIVGFNVYDPTGSTIRHREKIAEIIHYFYPGVSIEEVRNAQIGYEEYVAYIVLGNL